MNLFMLAQEPAAPMGAVFTPRRTSIRKPSKRLGIGDQMGIGIMVA